MFYFSEIIVIHMVICIKVMVFLHLMPCSLIALICRNSLLDMFRDILNTVKRFYMLVCVYQTEGHVIPEDCIVKFYCCEALQSLVHQSCSSNLCYFSISFLV
jgi:hypothetical protein